jgi:hypothetical protein
MATSVRERDPFVSPGSMTDTNSYAVAARVLRVANTHRDPEILFYALARELRAVLNLHTIGIALYDETADSLQWYAFETRGTSPGFSPLFRWENSACRSVYESQQPLVIDLARAC